MPPASSSSPGAVRSPWLLAGPIAALLLAALCAAFPDFDLDIWWHMRAGEMILAEGRVPHADVFTYTAQGRPWITHEWLAEVGLHLLHRLGGFDLLAIMRILLAVGALALGAWAGLAGARPEAGGAWARLPAAALGIALAAPMIGVRALARPHLVTALLLAATLLLLRLESSRGGWRWRWALLPVFLVWANVHSGFVQGFLLIGLYWAGEALAARLGQTDGAAPRPDWKGRALVFGLLVLVTLINPSHVHALLYPFRLTGRAEFTDIIVELRGAFHPSHRGALFQMALVASGAAMVGFAAVARRRVVWALLLPGLAFGLLAVRYVRGVGELAPLVPAVLAAHGAWLGRGRLRARIASLGIAAAALGGAAVLAAGGIPVGQAPNLRLGLGIDPSTVPAGSVRFLREAPVPGRVFNLMSFGSYLIHELWPEKQVYIDGRLEVFPPGFLAAYRAMLDTGAGWDEAVATYGITAAIIDYRAAPGGNGLGERLRDDPDWVCVHFSETAIVYARRVPENEALLARFGSRFDPALRSVESLDAFLVRSAPEEIEQAVRALTEMMRITPEEPAPALALGLLLDRLGRCARAAEVLRQAVALRPRLVAPRLLLANALARSGDPDEAVRAAQAAYGLEPGNVEPHLFVSEIERSRNRVAEALAALDAGARVDPDNYLIALRQGALNGQLGRLGQARTHLERALALHPGEPAALQNLEILRRIEAGEPGQ